MPRRPAERALEHDDRALVGVLDVDVLHQRAHQRQPAAAVGAARRAPVAFVAHDHADPPSSHVASISNERRPGPYACSTAFAHASCEATVMSNASSSVAPCARSQRRSSLAHVGERLLLGRPASR